MPSNVVSSTCVAAEVHSAPPFDPEFAKKSEASTVQLPLAHVNADPVLPENAEFVTVKVAELVAMPPPLEEELSWNSLLEMVTFDPPAYIPPPLVTAVLFWTVEVASVRFTFDA